MKKITGRLKPFKQILQMAGDVSEFGVLFFDNGSTFNSRNRLLCDTNLELIKSDNSLYDFKSFGNIQLKKEWLTDIKEEVDWSKVPVDTKCAVWKDNSIKLRRYYAGLSSFNNKPTFYNEGCTSWSTKNKFTSTWKNYELYKESEL